MSDKLISTRREADELNSYDGSPAAPREPLDAAILLNGYVAQLKSRMATPRERDLEVGALQEQLSTSQLMCTLVSLQCAEERRIREELEERVRDLEAELSARTDPKSTVAMAPVNPAEPSPAAAVDDADEPATLPLTVLHVEGRTPFRDAVRGAVEQSANARYMVREGRPAVTGNVLLAINLCAVTGDPLAAVSRAAGDAGEDLRAFAYCAEGANGLVIGVADIFPQPFDPNGCATRLLKRPGSVRRVLAVSEEVETMGVVRELLGRAQCSTSVAFDGRQALELLPILNPDMILIDLAMPRGEALRLVSRLKSDPTTAAIPLGLFCSKPLDTADFRSHMQRIIRALPFSTADLTRAMTEVLAKDASANAKCQPAPSSPRVDGPLAAALGSRIAGIPGTGDRIHP